MHSPDFLAMFCDLGHIQKATLFRRLLEGEKASEGVQKRISKAADQ